MPEHEQSTIFYSDGDLAKLAEPVRSVLAWLHPPLASPLGYLELGRAGPRIEYDSERQLTVRHPDRRHEGGATPGS